MPSRSSAASSASESQAEAAEESLQGYPQYDDMGLKRQERIQGMRIRTLYGPQAIYHSTFIDADDEAGSRHTVGASIPLSEFWEMAVLDHISYFALKNESKYAARESIELRIGMNPGMDFNPWFALRPYINFDGAEGEGIGLETGFSNKWKNGAVLSAEAFAWRPWDEGYSTIIEDGRKYGVGAAFTLPVVKNLQLSGRASYEEYDLGFGAKSGAQYAGNRYMINARGYCRLFHLDGAYMDTGFRTDDLKDEYLVGTELGAFIQVDFQRYFKPDGFHAVNPVSEVFAQDAGMSFQYAFSPRLGLTGEGFIGRDPDRDLQFGELYGLRGRLITVVSPHIRIWAEAAHLKTNTTLESAGGSETTITFGINYAF